MKFPLMVSAALIGLALATSARASTENTSLASVATALAGRSVEVRCVHFADPGTAGDADFATGKVRLAFDVCRALRAPRVIAPAYPRADTGFSVVTLGHEAAHMRGIRDEQKAETFGWRNVRRTALMLGYTHRQLPMIVSQARATTYGN